MPGLDIKMCAFGEVAGCDDSDDFLYDLKPPPNYSVVGRLGQGAFGEVRALHTCMIVDSLLPHYFCWLAWHCICQAC